MVFGIAVCSKMRQIVRRKALAASPKTMVAITIVTHFRADIVGVMESLAASHLVSLLRGADAPVARPIRPDLSVAELLHSCSAQSSHCTGGKRNVIPIT
jgi:hypothetical protein